MRPVRSSIHPAIAGTNERCALDQTLYYIEIEMELNRAAPSAGGLINRSSDLIRESYELIDSLKMNRLFRLNRISAVSYWDFWDCGWKTRAPGGNPNCPVWARNP